ncbi:MAG: hypothetical protein WCS27_15610, partial [Victivallaceae bacterium]
MKKSIFIWIVVSLSCLIFADDKSEMKLTTEKDFIKSLRFAAGKKDKESLDKIASEMEKYYCSSPGYEEGFIIIRKVSFLIEQGKYQEAISFIEKSLKMHKRYFNKVALIVSLILK